MLCDPEGFAAPMAISLRSALDTSAATTILSALASWRGSQVVRSRSAKPLFAGSIPAPASLNFKRRCRFVIDIDSRMPAHQDAIDLQGRTAMPTTDAIGEQVIEAVIAGPEGANRLFTISGAANVCIEATRQQRATETWTFLVGPPLTRLQFHRAIGTASIASQIVSVQNTPREFTVNIHSVEADWDDENQRVNVRVEIGIIANGATVTITQIRYWIAILAQM